MNFSELLAPGSIGEDIVLVLVVLSTLANMFIIYRLMLVRDPLGARLKSLNERREQLKAGIVAPKKRRTQRAQREKSVGMMRHIVNRMNLLRSSEAKKTQEKLSQAGYRSRDALTIFYFSKLCMPFVFGVVGLILIFGLNIVKGDALTKSAVALVVVVIGAYAPDLAVRNQIGKRQALMKKALPDALDLLVICAEAGQSLDGALNRVAGEVGSTCPVLAEELSLTAIELGLLPERRMALENLNKRTGLPSIKAVVNTLLQTEKYGTPIAQSLRVLSSEFRNERMMRAEEKAARLPAVMTVPLIIFILPPLFIVLLGPAILRVADMLPRMTGGG